MDTVRSEYSDTSSALGTSRFSATGGGGSSNASLSFVDSSSYGSSRGSTTRSDFLSNYEQKFLTRKAEKKKKREREKRLADASSNQLTADDKRRADREAERLVRKAEMATWLPTKEALERVALERKKRSREQLRDVLRWYPPLEEEVEKSEASGKSSGPQIQFKQQEQQRKTFAEMQPVFSPDAPHARDARRLEQQRTLDTRIQTQTSALQRRIAELQQKMDCVEHLQAERRSPERRQGGNKAMSKMQHRGAAGRGLVEAKVSRLAPLSGVPTTTTQSMATLPPAYPQQQSMAHSRSASSSYFFRDTPTQLAHAMAAEAAELDAFLLTHKRERRREAAARKVQATWRMVRQRRRYRKWRRWRTETRRTFFQVWSLSHRIKKHAEFAAKRKYLRAWRAQVKGAIELLRIELRLFKEAETQAELPKIVMNLAFTASEDDDAYTRKVLANPLKHSYFTGFVNAAFASIEKMSELEGSKNRVRLLKAQHVEARRAIAKKIVQRCFLLWKKVHSDQQRIGLNAQLCIKRAARLAFQHRPVWAAEKQLNIFELWARWAAFSRAKRLGVPMPFFAQPLPLWDTWLHNYHERQIRKVKAAAKAPLARMKRCFRQFRVFAAFALHKRLANEKAVRHFRLTWSRAVLLEWREAIAESAYEKKLSRSVLSGWREYAKRKARLRPAKQQVLDMRLQREQQRAWGAWRNVQLRSCFKRELHRARLQSQPKWRWKVQRLLLVWMDIRSQLHKWQIFVAWKHAVQRRKLFLTLRAHCDVLRRKHLLYGVFGAWKAVVWKQEDEFLEDRLQLSAWDTYKELSPLLPDLFYGCYSDAAAIFGGVPSAALSLDAGAGTLTMISARPPPTPGKDDALAKRQQEICAYHVALLQGSVVEARNLILMNKHLINGVDELTGNSALHVVAGQIEEPVRRFEIITLLLSEGACTWDKPNRHGLTPKQLAPDEDTRGLMERGVYTFHSQGVLKRARDDAARGDDDRNKGAKGLAESRLVWCLVALMSSEYVRGNRLAGDYRREWFSVLRDELWLRRGRVCFASTSSFSPAIQRCRAFLNGMKRRVCRSKDDVVLELWTQAQKTGSSRALIQGRKASSGGAVGAADRKASGGRGRPMLIKSGTRRMLSRDLARMEEKIDLLSWLKNTPDDPTSDAAIQKEAEDKEDEAELSRIQAKVRALGDYGAYAETLLTPVLNDERAEQELVLSFVGVLFSLSFPLDTILTMAMRLEDECTRLEAEVLQNYQAIMRAELRCRSPELPTGLPLLRYFTEQPDAEFFFKRELLLVNLELFRMRKQQGLSGGITQEEDEDEDVSASPSMSSAGELLLEVEMLLAKAQRKERKVAKKVLAVQQQVAALHEAYARVMLVQQQPSLDQSDTTPASIHDQRVADICSARMRLESERLRLANLHLKQLEWAEKASELVTMKDALRAEHGGTGRGSTASALLDLSNESPLDRDELQHKKRFLTTQLQAYLQAIKAHGVAKTNSSGALLTLPMTDLRRLHKATTKALWTLLITNLFRSGCCWLAETLATQEEEAREAFDEDQDADECVRVEELPDDQPGVALRKKTVVIPSKDGSGSTVVAEIAEPVTNVVASTFAAARKASAAVHGPVGGSVAHRRSSLTNARGVLDTLQRSSASTEMTEIHTAMMRENYTSSSQLLFESDRDALEAEEERARRREAELLHQKGYLRSKLEPVAELNPITGLAETSSSRMMSEGEMAAIATSKSESATLATTQSSDAAAARKRSRKREQLRQAMAQRQVQRLAGEAAFISSETEKEGSTSEVPEKNTVRQPLVSQAVVHGDVEVGFGNFVVGSPLPVSQKQQQQQQHPQIVAGLRQPFTRVSSTPSSTPTDKMLAAIAAESLWRRGGAGRRQGDGGSGAAAAASPASAGGAKGSNFELFASAEDEMAFNMSFRAMSAAKERRATPSGSHRLSMSIVAGSGIDRDVPVESAEAAASSDDHDSLAEGMEGNLLRLAERFNAAQEIAWLGNEAVDSVAETTVAEEAEPDTTTQVALGLAPATMPDLSSIVSETEESEFFDQTLQHYLNHVRRDTAAKNDNASRPLETQDPKTSDDHPSDSDAESSKRVDGSDNGETAPVGAAPLAVVADEPVGDSAKRLRAPYIKWESGSASPAAPLPVASATTEERVHRPLLIESTPLRPQVTVVVTKTAVEPGPPASHEDQALREALSQIERKVEEEAEWQQHQKEPRKLSLSGKSFAMRVRHRKASDSGGATKAQSRTRSSTMPSVPSFDSSEIVAPPSEQIDDLDLPMSLSVPKIMVTIQRKSSPDTETNNDSALTLEDTAAVASVPPMRQPSLLSLCELSIKASKAKDEKERKPKPAKDVSRRKLSQRGDPPSAAIAKPRKQSQAPTIPVEFCLEGESALASSASSSALLSAKGGDVQGEDDASLPSTAYIPQLSEDQKRGVWRDFTATALTDAMQDAYAHLYPHVYEPATPLISAPPASPKKRRASHNKTPTAEPPPATMPVEKQIELDKRFWSAVEGYKTVGVAGLIPLDEKTAKARRQDCAVVIYQQFLRPGLASRLVWLDMYAEELRAVEQRLLQAPTGLFDALQQTAQLHISTVQQSQRE